MVSDVSRLSAAEVSLSADLIAQRGFGTSRRGFNPDEVRAFLTQVAKEFRALRQRESALEQALREAEHRAAHPKWDENTLLSAVGEETASILRSAHAAAADIRAKSEENAARILKEAHDQAEATRGEADTVLGKRTEEADAAAAQIRQGAVADAERTGEAARQQAEAVRQQTDAERRAMVEAAQTTRERILTDLARKRKVAAVQIEQLRAGRERLLESYRVVRRTLDEVTDELHRADAEARAAAEAVGRRQSASVDGGEAGEAGPQPAAVVAGEGRPDDPSSVKDLFARIRAGQVQATAGARQAVAEAQPAATTQEAPTVQEAPAVQVAPAGREAPSPQEAPASRETPVAVDVGTAASAAGGRDPQPATQVPAGTVDAPAAADGDTEQAVTTEQLPEPAIPNPHEAALQRRDEAVGSIEGNLARRLKRALQDEQNELLDRLRNVRGRPSADAILPSRDLHASRFAEAGRPTLEQAATAGTAFAAALRGGDLSAEWRPAVDDLADDLAGAVVDPLRRRLEGVFAAQGDGDTAALAESIGSAYREWKTQRIESTAADHVASAFARGAFLATPDVTRLRWIVDDVDGPCPDCDDNALAGALPKGEIYPTGQAHPPAHPGCRCLLVPEPA